MMKTSVLLKERLLEDAKSSNNFIWLSMCQFPFIKIHKRLYQKFIKSLYPIYKIIKFLKSEKISINKKMLENEDEMSEVLMFTNPKETAPTVIADKTKTTKKETTKLVTEPLNDSPEKDQQDFTPTSDMREISSREMDLDPIILFVDNLKSENLQERIRTIESLDLFSVC